MAIKINKLSVCSQQSEITCQILYIYKIFNLYFNILINFGVFLYQMKFTKNKHIYWIN